MRIKSSSSKSIEAAIEQLRNAIQETINNDLRQAGLNFTHISEIHELVDTNRKAMHLNKGALSLMAGVTPRTMRRFESDPSSIRVSTLLSVLDVLGMTLYAGPAKRR